mmetsp:Transcript_23248/g.68750  ORF Transcript_23248/g.68750 Transcript_23248/m.68750 type:complete len:232 (-) Transcript_23248:4482-5177(-)
MAGAVFSSAGILVHGPYLLEDFVPDLGPDFLEDIAHHLRLVYPLPVLDGNEAAGVGIRDGPDEPSLDDVDDVDLVFAAVVRPDVVGTDGPLQLAVPSVGSASLVEDLFAELDVRSFEVGAVGHVDDGDLVLGAGRHDEQSSAVTFDEGEIFPDGQAIETGAVEVQLEVDLERRGRTAGAGFEDADGLAGVLPEHDDVLPIGRGVGIAAGALRHDVSCNDHVRLGIDFVHPD